MRCKTWLYWFFGLTVGTLVLIAATVALVDPYFHFHKPLTELWFYPLNNERSMNDGILRNFDYDVLYAGTSMTENTHASLVEELFGGTCVKSPAFGASLAEIDNLVQIAAEANPDLKLVFRCLDTGGLVSAEDSEFFAEGDYPMYLYNRNPLDDVKYLLNRDVFLPLCVQPILGRLLNGTRGITHFDDYGRWDDTAHIGATQVQVTPPAETVPLTEEDVRLLHENLENNVLRTARANPQITFYLYLPPYSVGKWGSWWSQGLLERQFEIERITAQTLLGQPNIRYFSFNTCQDITCDLMNYHDWSHYRTNINDRIVREMAAGNYELTEQNYTDYLAQLRELYTSIDYTNFPAG